MDAYGHQYAHPLGIGGFAAYLRLKMNCLGIFHHVSVQMLISTKSIFFIFHHQQIIGSHYWVTKLALV